MQPRAILILYQPGHKLKNHKYLLSIGSNIVGSDDRCQVIIDSKKYFSQQFVANFYLSQDFMYIQALCENMIQFKSNMEITNNKYSQNSQNQKKKQIYKYIQQGCRYLVPMEESFYIGPYKAMVQVQHSQDLKKINNLLNLEKFQTPRDEQLQSNKTQKIQIQNETPQRNFHKQDQVLSDRTQKVYYQNENQDFQQTLLIDEDDPLVFQPTLLVDYQYQNSHHFDTQTMKPNINKKEPYKIQQKANIYQKFHQQINSKTNFNIHQNQNTQNVFKQLNGQKRFNSNSQKVNINNSLYHNQKSQHLSQNQLSMFTKQKQKKSQIKYSQQILYQTIKKQQTQLRKQIQKLSQNQNDQDSISWADTIQDHQQLAQNKQQNNINSNQSQFSDQMPATIQQDQPIKKQSNSISKMKGIKSMSQQYPQNNYLKNLKMYKSQKFTQINKQKRQQHLQQNDLWGALIGSSLQKLQEQKKPLINQQQKQRKKRFNIKTDIPLVLKNNFISNLNLSINSTIVNKNGLNNSGLSNNSQNKDNQVNSMNQIENTNEKKVQTNIFNYDPSSSKRRLFQEQKKLRLVNLCCFKPKPQERLILRKRGFQIVREGAQQDYQILIIGQHCKATPKLILAIIKDKNIVNQQWIHNNIKYQTQQHPQSFSKTKQKLKGTVQGIQWQYIINKININIFQNNNFYLTQYIDQKFQQIYKLVGGSIITQLNKRKKINIIINCQKQKDKEFYNINKNCKNWKFYDQKIITFSILTGQIQFKKYQIDSMSF